MDIILKDSDFEAMPTELRQPLLAFLSARMAEMAQLDVQEENSFAIKVGRTLLRPNVIPIEAACSVVFGLNENSIVALEAILKADPNEGLPRKTLGKILGSESAINGTIGSINRRFIHRFNFAIYDIEAALKEMPLITYKKSYHIETGHHEVDHLAFRLALHMKKNGLDLETSDVTLTMPDQKIIRLSSMAYQGFNLSKGYINLYQDWPDCPVLLTGHSPEIMFDILQAEGFPVVMCTSTPSTSVVFRDGSNTIYKIGAKSNEQDENRAKCIVLEELATQCLDPDKIGFKQEKGIMVPRVSRSIRHKKPLSKGGKA